MSHRRRGEKIFEEITVKHFPNLTKTIYTSKKFNKNEIVLTEKDLNLDILELNCQKSREGSSLMV